MTKNSSWPKGTVSLVLKASKCSISSFSRVDTMLTLTSIPGIVKRQVLPNVLSLFYCAGIV